MSEATTNVTNIINAVTMANTTTTTTASTTETTNESNKMTLDYVCKKETIHDYNYNDDKIVKLPKQTNSSPTDTNHLTTTTATLKTSASLAPSQHLNQQDVKLKNGSTTTVSASNFTSSATNTTTKLIWKDPPEDELDKLEPDPRDQRYGGHQNIVGDSGSGDEDMDAEEGDEEKGEKQVGKDKTNDDDSNCNNYGHSSRFIRVTTSTTTGDNGSNDHSHRYRLAEQPQQIILTMPSDLPTPFHQPLKHLMHDRKQQLLNNIETHFTAYYNQILRNLASGKALIEPQTLFNASHYVSQLYKDSLEELGRATSMHVREIMHAHAVNSQQPLIRGSRQSQSIAQQQSLGPQRVTPTIAQQSTSITPKGYTPSPPPPQPLWSQQSPSPTVTNSSSLLTKFSSLPSSSSHLSSKSSLSLRTPQKITIRTIGKDKVNATTCVGGGGIANTFQPLRTHLVQTATNAIRPQLSIRVLQKYVTQSSSSLSSSSASVTTASKLMFSSSGGVVANPATITTSTPISSTSTFAKKSSLLMTKSPATNSLAIRSNDGGGSEKISPSPYIVIMSTSASSSTSTLSTTTTADVSNTPTKMIVIPKSKTTTTATNLSPVLAPTLTTSTTPTIGNNQVMTNVKNKKIEKRKSVKNDTDNGTETEKTKRKKKNKDKEKLEMVKIMQLTERSQSNKTVIDDLNQQQQQSSSSVTSASTSTLTSTSSSSIPATMAIDALLTLGKTF